MEENRSIKTVSETFLRHFFGNVNYLAWPDPITPRTDCDHRVWDNGWVLELNLEAVKARASVMELSPDEVTADRTFDEGYATWVGITPDDHQRRAQERAEIQKLAKTDLLAYMQAMKEWGLNREKRFIKEGWRKMKVRNV